jgi:hypothetical protein
MPTVFYLVRFQTDFQIELACRDPRHASQYPCVGRKREWNMSQVIHSHSRGDGYRRELGDLHCSLADNVAQPNIL